MCAPRCAHASEGVRQLVPHPVAHGARPQLSPHVARALLLGDRARHERLAPPLAGKDLANPLASVLTVGMMLAHLGHADEERRLEGLVARAIAEKKCTRDVGGELGTRAVGDWVVSELAHAF